MVQNAVRKAESKNEKKKWSKVKITGKGQRGQKTIQNDSFQAVTSIFQKVLADFDELWQGYAK